MRDGDEVRVSGGVTLPALRDDEVYVISVVVPGGGVAFIGENAPNPEVGIS